MGWCGPRFFQYYLEDCRGADSRVLCAHAQTKSSTLFVSDYKSTVTVAHRNVSNLPASILIGVDDATAT